MRHNLQFLVATIGAVGLSVVFDASADYPIAGSEPHDPPVAYGGDGGPSPWDSDWQSFSWEDTSQLPYRVNNVNSHIYCRDLAINGTNEYFDDSHCCIDADEFYRVAHIHFSGDYYAEEERTKGEAFWDWTYSGFDPLPEGGSNPVGARNCFAYAYHTYMNSGTLANYWVNGSSPYTAFLNEVSSEHQYAYFWPVEAEDRCENGPRNHVWIIDEDSDNPEEAEAVQIRWKNASSGIYTWNHPEQENWCPIGGDPPSTGHLSAACYIFRKQE